MTSFQSVGLHIFNDEVIIIYEFRKTWLEGIGHDFLQGCLEERVSCYDIQDVLSTKQCVYYCRDPLRFIAYLLR
jgi:hypothetical protein